MEKFYRLFSGKNGIYFDSIKEYKINFIINLVAFLDVILHVICTLLFIVPTNSLLLLILNSIATLICIIAFFVNLKGFTNSAVWILTLEIGVYSFIWVVFLGPYIGAQYFIFSVLIPHYLFASFNRIPRFFLTVFLFICLIGSSWYGLNNPPILQHPFPHILNISIMSMIFLSFLIILILNESVDKFGENLYKNNISKIERISYKDQLTELANRSYFEVNKDKILKNISIKNYCIALIDLDFFKNINDTYSHEAGDMLLKHFSNIILNNLTPDDTAMRWGGEEFLIIMEGVNQEQASVKANKILEAVHNEPLQYKDIIIDFSFTCGVTEIKPDELFSHYVNIADELLYLGKSKGRNIVVLNKRKA